MNNCCEKCVDYILKEAEIPGNFEFRESKMVCSNPQCECHQVDVFFEKFDMEKLKDATDVRDKEWHRLEWDKFIKEIQSQERARLKEKIEGNRKDVRPDIRIWLTGNRDTNEGYNEALSDIVKILEE